MVQSLHFSNIETLDWILNLGGGEGSNRKSHLFVFLKRGLQELVIALGIPSFGRHIQNQQQFPFVFGHGHFLSVNVDCIEIINGLDRLLLLHGVIGVDERRNDFNCLLCHD